MFSRKKLLIFGAIVLVLLLAIVIIPKIQSALYHGRIAPELDSLAPKERVDALKDVELFENAARATLAQIFGGAVLLAGLYFTYRNVRIAEEGKLTDRFSKAVEMLGSENLDVRLGGIYALERIARDSQKDHWTVMEVLTAYIREKSPYNHRDAEAEKRLRRIDVKAAEDIQAAMTVIGRRKWTETETYPLDLQNVNLAGCNLSNAKLGKARLRRSNLSRAILIRADLSKAELHLAVLSFAFLNRANLNKAAFPSAKLNGADLYETDLKSAKVLPGQLLKAKNVNRAILSEDLTKRLEKLKAEAGEPEKNVDDSDENQDEE